MTSLAPPTSTNTPNNQNNQLDAARQAYNIIASQARFGVPNSVQNNPFITNSPNNPPAPK